MEGNSSQQATGINRNFPVESNVNPGYLKPKVYLSPTTPIAGITESFTRPRVIQWDPHIAAEGSTVSVVLEQSISESDEIPPMKLVFGQLVVETNQQQQRAPAMATNDLNMSMFWITLVAKVPRLLDTQVESGPQVPMSICVYDNSARENAIDHWNFGVFTYANDTREEGNSRNRKRREPDSAGGMYPSSKRPNSMDDEQLFSQLLAPYDESPEKGTPSPQGSHTQAFIAPQTANPSAILSQITPTNTPYQQPLNSSTASSQQGQPSSSHNEPPTIHPRPYEMQQQMAPGPSGGAGYSEYMSSTSVPVNIQPNPNPTPYGSYNLPYSSYPPQSVQSENYINAASASSSSSYPSYPPQQQPTIGSIQTSPGTEHPFAGVLSRAQLKITGDLMDMTFNWSPDEWQAGRKLIQFWRRQHTDTKEEDSSSTGEVECGFETITQEEYQQQRLRDSLTKESQPQKSPLVVSCIYWRERNDYYITSVDCIYLLEGLIGVQFTVEEKNRIRRNLEGYRPCTVSKCKSDCAEFFKLIMGFPHPKPRNIEKDVKVFPWKILPSALQKIIGKYTPSYSSTMAVNLSS